MTEHIDMSSYGFTPLGATTLSFKDVGLRHYSAKDGSFVRAVHIGGAIMRSLFLSSLVMRRSEMRQVRVVSSFNISGCGCAKEMMRWVGRLAGAVSGR